MPDLGILCDEGSRWKYSVIMGIADAAITRAREAVVVVGAEAAMRTALQGTQGDVRLSSLHDRLAAAADRLDLPRSARILMLALQAQLRSGMLPCFPRQ